MSGLKAQWGVGAPAQAPSDEQAKKFKASFEAKIGVINTNLRYTLTHAEDAKHQPLASRRDACLAAYQSTLQKIDPANPNKAKTAIEKVLSDASSLSDAVANLQKESEAAFNDWTSHQEAFNAATLQIEELESWEHPHAGALRAPANEIRAQADQRKYSQSVQSLIKLQSELKPVYNEYLKQKEAMAQYEPGLQALRPRLDPVLKDEHLKLHPQCARAVTAQQTMEASAQSKNYVEALKGLGGLTVEVEAYEAALQELEVNRKQYEDAWSAVQGRLTDVQQSTHKKLEAQQQEILAASAPIEAAAQQEEFQQASQMVSELSIKVDAYVAAVAALEQQKTGYDAALAALQPRIQPASQSEEKYAKLQSQQEDLAKTQTEMEAAAQAGDYDLAQQHLQALTAKLDTYEQAKAEVDAKIQAYESAVAALQPRLQAASLSQTQYAKLQPQQEVLAKRQTEMEAAAQAGDYERAQQLLQQLGLDLEACEAQRQQIDQQKAAYDAALAILTPKMKAVNAKQYLNLIDKHKEIAKDYQAMSASANSGDFVNALQQCNALQPKADAYITAASKEVEPPILGSAQSERADAVLKKLPEEDRKKVQALMDGAQSEAEKQYLLKGVASGHSAAELEAFATKIKNKDAQWLRDNLSLTSSSKGTGVQQQWSMSCNATTVQAVKGQMDPIYALKMHEDNPNLDQVDKDDATKMNPELAADQKAMLTSAYTGGVKGAGKQGGDAVAINSGTPAAGRWADDLLNNNSDQTGITYSTKQLDGSTVKVDDALKAIDKGMGKGQPVPLVIGNSTNKYAHYVLVTGMDPGPPKRYTIHDPGNGTTSVQTEDQLKNGTMTLSWSQIGAFEEPETKAVK